MVDLPSQQQKVNRVIKFSIPQAAYVKDKYTVYKLQMETQMNTWTVEHRYSEFSQLHHQAKILFQITKTRKHLPKFPPKKINKMKEQVVESRKVSLANYMNELSLCFNIFDDQDIIEFIQMQDKEYMRQYFQNLYEYQENLLKDSQYHRVSDVSDKSGGGNLSDDHTVANKSPTKMNPNQASQLTSSLTNGVKPQTMAECERRVIELLEVLETDADKFSNNLKSFEEYYFTNKPCLSTNYIKRLFFGDGYKIKGLLQHINSLDKSSISVVNLINFIARLLDYRRNHQIEQFRQIFVQCDQVFIKKLGLDWHISNPSCNNGALYIINEYINIKLIDPSQILTSQEQFALFEKWRKQKQVVQKSYMSSVSPLRLQKQDSTKNTMKKPFNFEKHNLKKNHSFIGFESTSDNHSSMDQQTMRRTDVQRKQEEDDYNRLKLIKQKSHNLAYRSQIGFDATAHGGADRIALGYQPSQFKQQSQRPSQDEAEGDGIIENASDASDDEEEEEEKEVVVEHVNLNEIDLDKPKIHKVSDDSNAQVQRSTGTSNNNFLVEQD